MQREESMPLPTTSPRPLNRDSLFMYSAENASSGKKLSLEMTGNIIERQITDEMKDEEVIKSTIVKNQSHSLKRSILNKFIPLTFSLLLAVSLCTIAGLYISSRYILNETYQMLTEQYTRYGGIITKGESAAITAVLAWTGLEAEAGMTCDFYRSNYSISDPNKTYLGYLDLLARPLVDDEARFPGRNISLAHSSYVFPNMTYDDMVHRLSEPQQNNRDQIAKIDPAAKAIYEYKENTLQSFVGMEEDGMFVVYPGQSMERDGSIVDPRNRSWYQKGKEQQNVTIIVDPYIDYFTGEPVISLARSVHNVETGEFTGVVGLDFLVTSLQEYVLPAYGLEREIVLFVSSGRVLLDSDWFQNSSSTEIAFTSHYNALEDPVISHEEWAVIKAVEPGQNFNLDISSSYHCYVYRFADPLQDLVFMACATKDVLREEATELRDVINDHWKLSLILVIVIFVVLIALTLSVFYYTVSTLARGVDRSYKEINNLFHTLRMQAAEHQENLDDEPGDRLSRNLDASCLALLAATNKDTKNLDAENGAETKKRPALSVRPGAGVRAMSRLFSSTDSFNANPFWNKKHPFLHHHTVSERFRTRPPNTPPPSGRHLECSTPHSTPHNSLGHHSPTMAGRDKDKDFDDLDVSDDEGDEYYCDDDSDEEKFQLIEAGVDESISSVDSDRAIDDLNKDDVSDSVENNRVSDLSNISN